MLPETRPLAPEISVWWGTPLQPTAGWGGAAQEVGISSLAGRREARGIGGHLGCGNGTSGPQEWRAGIRGEVGVNRALPHWVLPAAWEPEW